MKPPRVGHSQSLYLTVQFKIFIHNPRNQQPEMMQFLTRPLKFLPQPRSRPLKSADQFQATQLYHFKVTRWGSVWSTIMRHNKGFAPGFAGLWPQKLPTFKTATTFYHSDYDQAPGMLNKLYVLPFRLRSSCFRHHFTEHRLFFSDGTFCCRAMLRLTSPATESRVRFFFRCSSVV